MIEAKTVLEYLEKYRYYKNKWILVLALLLPTISIILPTYSIGTVSITPTITLILFAVFSIILVIIFYYSNQRLPSVKNGSIGILLVIKAQNQTQFQEIESKFIDNIRDILESANILNFTVLPVDWSRTVKYNLRKKDDITSLLKKTKSLYLILANCVEGCSSGKEIFSLKMQYSVLHKTFADQIEKKFSIDFNELSQSISSIIVSKSNDIDEFKISSIDVAIVCKYIVGVSLYLSLELNAANLILSELYDMVVKMPNERKTIDGIKKRMPSRLYEINIIIYLLAYSKYFASNSDKVSLMILKFDSMR